MGEQHWMQSPFCVTVNVTSGGPQGIPGKDGLDGPKGDQGVAGYTPVRGVDYWTKSDIAAIIDYIDRQLGVIENGAY